MLGLRIRPIFRLLKPIFCFWGMSMRLSLCDPEISQDNFAGTTKHHDLPRAWKFIHGCDVCSRKMLKMTETPLKMNEWTFDLKTMGQWLYFFQNFYTVCFFFTHHVQAVVFFGKKGQLCDLDETGSHFFPWRQESVLHVLHQLLAGKRLCVSPTALKTYQQLVGKMAGPTAPWSEIKENHPGETKSFEIFA